MRVGSGSFNYDMVEGWGNLPQDSEFEDIPGIAVDSQDRVFVLSRGPDPVIVLDRDGGFLDSWGDGLFVRPHGISIGADDSVYCVDDKGHAVRKFTPDGRLLLTIETAEHPADTGYVVGKPRSVRRSGPPFCYPSGLFVSAEGEIYVTDGYGNARVHKFDADGHLLLSWGEPGSGPGEFILPHGVCVDKSGRVYVADRQNQRVQVFDSRGGFLDVWSGVRCPSCLVLDSQDHLFVGELGLVMQRGADGKKRIASDAPKPRITLRDLTGDVLAQWGASDPGGEGLFFSPHSIAIDSAGDLYVGEVSASFSGGAAPANRPRLHKYVRT